MLTVLRPARSAVGLAIVLGLLAAGPAQGQTLLRWKYKPGESLHYVMNQDMTQNISGGETPVKVTTNVVMDMTLKVEAVDEKGVATLTQTLDRIHMKTQAPQGMVVEYDSASEKPPEGMAKMIAPMFQGIVKKPTTLKMTPRGEVLEVKLPQEVLETLKKGPAGGPAASMFSEEGMKQMMEIAVLPEEPVAPGATWTRKAVLSNPALGKETVETTFRYEGPENRNGQQLQKITTDTRTKRAEEPGKEKPKTPVEVKQQQAKGTIYFDAAAGHLAESISTMTMKLEATFGGQTMAQDIETKQQMKLQPAGAAKAEAK